MRNVQNRQIREPETDVARMKSEREAAKGTRFVMGEEDVLITSVMILQLCE